MIDNEVIQAALIDDLKNYTDLVTLLAGSSEVRESQYQGSDFVFPAIRLQIDQQTPLTNRGESCDHATLVFNVRTYSELLSSRQCSQLASLVNGRFHRRNFHDTLTDSWYSWFRSSGFIGPRRVDPKVWMSLTTFSGTVYPTTSFAVPVP